MKFEDLEVWKRSARLSADNYKGIQQLKNYSFRDQLYNAGLSVPGNIVENFECKSMLGGLIRTIRKHLKLNKSFLPDIPKSTDKVQWISETALLINT